MSQRKTIESNGNGMSQTVLGCVRRRVGRTCLTQNVGKATDFMKITRIEPIPVSVPLKKGLSAKTAHGEHATSLFVLVRVHTDDGIVGLGEATISALWSGET